MHLVGRLFLVKLIVHKVHLLFRSIYFSDRFLMSNQLSQLFETRSQLTEEVLKYLCKLIDYSIELPDGLYLSKAEAALSASSIRQSLNIVADRAAYNRWLKNEKERIRVAGLDEQTAYRTHTLPRGNGTNN